MGFPKMENDQLTSKPSASKPLSVNTTSRKNSDKELVLRDGNEVASFKAKTRVHIVYMVEQQKLRRR